jgi:hypothetical protein
MADAKISADTSVAPVSADTVAGLQSGVNVQFAFSAMKPFFDRITINSKSANYTTVLGDAGQCIYHPVGDNNARTFTIDSNANVAYPIGTVIQFMNRSAATLSIAITSDAMTLAGTTTTGMRALAQNGTATAEKDTSTGWLISGTGLT